ncbi:TD and POZ domain-containing protein 3 [Araneus ventricosus]|uniref:TD and POZ domain-containing protein 3 n=1 Tax=Araneus ventricosus TaxID=182803 RepID=A0A4Y2QCX9_ARAVE|nr:TD and POZ domain-containing protein 3 [Araneus ventricosus]
MSENRKCFTFIWKIKNFNFCSSNSGIHSPVFFAHVLGGTNWTVYLYSDDKDLPGCLSCYIRRQNDSGPQLLQLDYELSLLAGNGSVLYSEIFLKKLYMTFNTDWKTALHVNKDEVFLHKKDLFMPDDTLTIRCRMWNSQDSISQSESCFVETSIKTQCKSFVGTITKLRCLGPGEIYPICIISSKENFLSSMKLCAVADDKLVIKMFANQKFFRPYRYKIFLRDIYGNKVKYGQGECHDSKLHCFPLTLSKEHLMENKRYYFPKNILTIECEIIFSTGKLIKNVELEYGFDFQDTQECISNALKTNLSSEESHSESFTTLKDDLNSLFKDGVLCDTELKTATETFPAHIAVLSARSSVFKSVFTNDMKKKTNKCVVINDLDADTVHRMLLYMYNDRLDDLEYESAKNLYFAAHKYNIVPLKHKCSNFLKQYILLKNCCDVLFLADKHQDEDLKNAVQDYITKNDKVVLFSDEWKNLEKNHPQLTIEVLRDVCMKKRS